MNKALIQRKTFNLYSLTCALVLLLIGCSPSLPKTKTDSNPQPGWLASKPADNNYYVGIGHGTKDGANNYIQEAKKSALEDLVSQIKVEVSSMSVLSQIDENKEFQQKYQQIIQTKVKDDIQDFEQEDSWQDEKNYWVYYRLSKQRYKDIKDGLRRDAVTSALDFFTKAKVSERNGDMVQALGFYFQGFRAIEKYLAEPIRIQFEGNDILLTNEIYANLELLLDKIQLTATPSEMAVNRRISGSGLTVTAKAFLKESNKPVADLPLTAAFEKGSGNVFPDYKTDDSGQTKILVTKIGAKDLDQTVGVKVNLLFFLGPDSSNICLLMAQKMTVPQVSILLNVQRPVVLVSSTERNFGIDKANQQLTNRLKNFLTNSGFEITDDRAKAELWMDVNADSEKGSVSGSIYITYVTAIIRVITLKDNKEIYSTTLDRIKGYSLDYERSSQESYDKSMSILEKEKMPQLLDAILQ